MHINIPFTLITRLLTWTTFATPITEASIVSQISTVSSRSSESSSLDTRSINTTLSTRGVHAADCSTLAMTSAQSDKYKADLQILRNLIWGWSSDTYFEIRPGVTIPWQINSAFLAISNMHSCDTWFVTKKDFQDAWNAIEQKCSAGLRGWGADPLWPSVVYIIDWDQSTRYPYSQKNC